jgi:hypothetical protein
MKAFTSEQLDDMFFCNGKYAWEYLHASEQRRQTLPGSNYFNKIKNFGENHCLLGEKHIEFVKFSCDEPDKCEYCSTHQWVGPPCTRIPQPYPDYEADGYHYKNEKRAEKRQLKTQQERNKKYEDYNWLAMFNDGLLKKLNVSDLNKYLSHHGMMHSLKLRKAEKIRVIQGHIASHLLNISEDNILLQENSDDSYGESSSSADESSEDIVLNDTLASMSESETEKSGDESQAEENVEDMFTTTRSGRVTTNWRVLKYK